MTHTISQVSRALSVSTRALRYYEEMGLIHSRRIEGYAYRVYDEDTVRRIEQILFLRSVRIPLRDIAVLLRGEDTREAIKIFRRRITEMGAEIDQLTAVRRLLHYLQETVSVSGSEGWKNRFRCSRRTFYSLRKTASRRCPPCRRMFAFFPCRD